MAAQLTDVDPAIAALQVEHWRTTPAWQKLAYVDELNQTLRLLGLSDLRRQYPHASEAQLQRRLAARWLGEALAERVYGPISEDANAAE